jgi:hypothetical protein
MYIGNKMNDKILLDKAMSILSDLQKASYIASLWDMPNNVRQHIIMTTDTCDERNFELFMACVNLYCVENDKVFNIKNIDESKKIIGGFILATACIHYKKSLEQIK